MIFKPEFTPKIIDGSKTQTRRLVKEGEKITVESNRIMTVWNSKNGKTKWQVGKTYAIQSGIGKACYEYCPLCFELKNKPCNRFPECNDKKLRIRITSIKKERLLDITEEDAGKEGFKAKKFSKPFGLDKQTHMPARFYFLSAFLGINKKIKSTIENPDTWVLEFEVEKILNA